MGSVAAMTAAPLVGVAAASLGGTQHALLVVSFVVLVWTGFALKYPDGWWAKPMILWEAQWPVRGTIHRIAAVVMMAVAVVHVITLIVSRKLRQPLSLRKPYGWLWRRRSSSDIRK